MSFTVDSRSGSLPSILEKERQPDLRTRILRLYVLFAALVLVVVLLGSLFVKRALERQALAAEASFAAAVAGQFDEQDAARSFEPAVIAALHVAGMDGPITMSLIDGEREVTADYRRQLNLPTGPDWQNWQRLVKRTAAFDDQGSFFTEDPAGQRWLHAFALLPSAQERLLVQRPAAAALTTTHLLDRFLAAAMAVFLAGGLFSWLVLSLYVIQPLQKLEALSERTRWRRPPTTAEEAQIEKLAGRSDQFGNLTRSLLAMQQETEQRLMQLSTLLETSRVVASTLDAAEVIDNILDQVQSLFGVDRCAVVVLDQREDLFRIRASRGLSAPYTRQLRIEPTEPNSLSMRALRNEAPIQISDTEADLAYVKFRARSRAEGFRSVLAIPLPTQHAPPAVLLLYKSQPYRYSYGELEMATSFGHHASIALENAALYALTDERLQEQTRRLEAIVESLHDGLILEGPSGRVLYCNQRALDWLRLSGREVRGRQSADLLRHLSHGAQESPELLEMLSGKGAGREGDVDLLSVTRDGRPRDLRIHLFDVNDAQGELLGRGQLWQDITHDKEVDRMKSALLSTVSHELRTPLATIKGFASTLLADDVHWDADAQYEFLLAISDETDRLTLLIQNLLDMSRIEAGMLRIHCEPHNLNDLVDQVVMRFQPPLNGNLRRRCDPHLPPAAMDVSRIATVIRNLLENAVKYSPADRLIDIQTRQGDQEVVFRIHNDGPAIPPEARERLFERFYRVDNGLTRQVGGTGLGLAICKGFVEAHNGRIWFEENGGGATFAFALPVDNTPLSRAAA
jgi:PAS domain S-box-containing protein